MRKPFLFTDDEVDAIYDFLIIAREVAETSDEKNRLSKIILNIENQTNYALPPMKQFAITAPGFENPDYVYAESREEAILQWADTVVCTEITEIISGDGSCE